MVAFLTAANTPALLLLTTATILHQPQLITSATPSTPTSFIDIHLTTKFTTTGSLETGYLFRIPASSSAFAGSPPKAPRWATSTAWSAGTSYGGTTAEDINGMTSNLKSKHPSFRVMTPPDGDLYLCNESKGVGDYTNPSGNSAGPVFDPDTLLSGFEGGYVLVERGHCTFESKARSAQRLGAAGVIVRNTLGSRYGLLDGAAPDAPEDYYSGTGPHWGATRWPVEALDYECGTNAAAAVHDGVRVGVRAEIPAGLLGFDPAPYAGNDAVLTGPRVDGNLCAEGVEGFERRCPSERCLLTGRNATGGGDGADLGDLRLEACCAWDVHIRMAGDGDDDGDAIPAGEEEAVTIPAVFVTMEHGEELYDLVVDAENNSGGGSSVQFVNVVVYDRWYPGGHWSGAAVWALAVVTLWIAGRGSAGAYRNSWKKISRAVGDGSLVFQRSATNSNAPGRERAETEETVDGELELAGESGTAGDAVAGATAGGGSDGAPPAPAAGPAQPPPDSDFSILDDDAAEDAMDDFVGGTGSRPAEPAAATTPAADGSFEPVSVGDPPAAAAPAPSAAEHLRQQQPAQQRINLQSRSTTAAMAHTEFKALHAIVFVMGACMFLFILFFFNLYKVVRVLYGLGGSVAMTRVIIYPAYNRLISSKHIKDGLAKKLQSNAFGNLPGCRVEQFKWMDIAAYTTGYALGIAWIVVSFSRVQPMYNVYYWLVQDVMGVCFCILILGIIQINSIMVATVLLSLMFLYDIFYVFISPHLFGSSVMIAVATGGANGIDHSFCDKYPSDSMCRGALAPLPMMLAMPWYNDFRGGFSMLGLGDIVLPGLLISFAARYDAARALVKKCSQTNSVRGGDNSADAEETNMEGEATDGFSRTRYHYHLGRVTKSLFLGYFGPLMIAYGVGLMFAYIAAWITLKGQPAMLYLVPACLGTTLFLGWRRRELSELWSGPKILLKANRMVCVSDRIPAAPAGAAVASGNLAETTTMV